MKFIVIVTIVFIVIAAAYAAPSHTKSTVAKRADADSKPTVPASKTSAPVTIADGNTNSHNNFGYVYDTAANFLNRLFNKN